MWNELTTPREISEFMHLVRCFHDSCIVRMQYISGASVDEQLAMYPINDRRSLVVIIQQQSALHPKIVLEFSKLHYLKLFPLPETYTCEILEATLEVRDGRIYWYDCSPLPPDALAQYEGTVICADKVRWCTPGGNEKW